MASRFAAGLLGRNLTSVRGQQTAVRRMATAAGENEFVAERIHHKEHAASKYPLLPTMAERCTSGGGTRCRIEQCNGSRYGSQ